MVEEGLAAWANHNGTRTHANMRYGRRKPKTVSKTVSVRKIETVWIR